MTTELEPGALEAAKEWPATAGCCYGEHGCVCPPMERALRGWIRGERLPAMTTDQRSKCLDEIGRVEGYDRAEHVDETDAELAGSVLNAWTDFARDKGLL